MSCCTCNKTEELEIECYDDIVDIDNPCVVCIAYSDFKYKGECND